MRQEAADTAVIKQDAQDNPAEEKARQSGWKPREEFQGDPESWVDASEYLKMKPLHEKIHKLKKGLDERDKVIHDLQDHVGKVSKAAYDKAIADLRKERREAVEVADVARVEELDQQIEEVKGMKPDNKQSIPPAIAEWEAKNGAWFYADEDIKNFGMSYANTYLSKKPGDFSGAMEAMEKAVKKAFPEKFETENARRKTPPPVEGGGSQPSKKGFTRSDLTEEQRKVGARFERMGIMSMDDYIKGLIEAGELKQ